MRNTHHTTESKGVPAPLDATILRGDYGYYLNGTAPIWSPGWITKEMVGFPWPLFACVGIFRFMDEGVIQSLSVINHNGALSRSGTTLPSFMVPDNFSGAQRGSYAITAIGTGSIVIPVPEAALTTLFFTMVDDWNELFLMMVLPALIPEPPQPVPSSGYAPNLISPPHGGDPSLIRPPYGGVVTGVAKRLNTIR